MLNTMVCAPVIGNALAYDAVLNPTLRGLDINAPGGLLVEDINGKQGLYTFTAQPVVTGGESVAANVSSFPYRLELQIRKIIGNGAGAAGNGTTGTSIALANMVPLA